MDIDTAAEALGRHVEAEADKRCRAEEKALNDDGSQPTGKRYKPKKYRALPDERRREIWAEVVARVVERKLVFHGPAPAGETGRWRTEKPITGDKAVDESELRGARVVYDASGRRRAEFDASGRRIYHWKPNA